MRIHSIQCWSLGTEFEQQKHTKHGTILLSILRCILDRSNDCGLTKVMIDLIEQENGLKFSKSEIKHFLQIMQYNYSLFGTILSIT